MFDKLIKNKLGGSSHSNYFFCLNTNVVLVLDPWICQTYTAKTDCKKVSKLLKTSKSNVSLRVVLFFGMLEKKSIYTKYLWLSDSNRIQTHSHLVHKRTLNHLAELAQVVSVCLWTKWF